MNKYNVIKASFVAILILSVLVSVIVVPSSASSLDSITIPDSYYTFVPRSAPDTNFLSTFQGRFYAGSYPDSFRGVVVNGSAERGTYFMFDPGGVPIDICHVSSEGVVTWSDVALSYDMWQLSFPAQPVFRYDYNFLETFCIAGVSPGTYYLDSERVFSNITYSYDWTVSTTLDGSEGIFIGVDVFDGIVINERGYRYYTNLLYIGGQPAYSSYGGFVSGWDGSIRVLTPIFFDSRSEMLAFYSTFDSSTTSSGGQFNEGFEKGKQAGLSEGREIGYSEGYDVGKADGFEEGRNLSGSENLGENLIGDTISAPFKALDNFVIYGSISLLDVLGACISLSLLIAFLKMFAGG